MKDTIEILSLEITEDSDGMRIDQVISNLSQIGSRSQATKLLKANNVFLNSRPVKSSFIAKKGQFFEIHLLLKKNEPLLNEYNFNLDVVYEDDDILVINKPAGLVVHPGAGNKNNTLVNALLYHTKTLSNWSHSDRPGIVHRLDKETSGLLVVAKNNKTHQFLSEQFKNRNIHRVYWALIFGCPKINTGTIKSYLVRHPKDRKRFASARDNNRKIIRTYDSTFSKGKWAVTHYKVVSSYSNSISLVHLRLESGRTHQIRVHLSEMGHSIVGDHVYGGSHFLQNIKSQELKKMIEVLSRFALHAAELGFTKSIEDKKQFFFSASWPEDLNHIVKFCNFSSHHNVLFHK